MIRTFKMVALKATAEDWGKLEMLRRALPFCLSVSDTIRQAVDEALDRRKLRFVPAGLEEGPTLDFGPEETEPAQLPGPEPEPAQLPEPEPEPGPVEVKKKLPRDRRKSSGKTRRPAGKVKGRVKDSVPVRKPAKKRG